VLFVEFAPKARVVRCWLLSCHTFPKGTENIIKSKILPYYYYNDIKL
jgi:hypothetical protein